MTVGLDKVFAQRISNRLSLYEKLACPCPQLGPFFPKFDLCIVNPSENSEICSRTCLTMGHHPLGALAEEFPGAFPTTTAPDKMSTCFNNQWSTGYFFRPGDTVDGCEILHHLGWNPRINGMFTIYQPSIGAGFHWPIHSINWFRRIPRDWHRKSGPSATFTTVIVRPPWVTGTVALKITTLVKECMSVKKTPIWPRFFWKI